MQPDQQDQFNLNLGGATITVASLLTSIPVEDWNFERDSLAEPLTRVEMFQLSARIKQSELESLEFRFTYAFDLLRGEVGENITLEVFQVLDFYKPDIAKLHQYEGASAASLFHCLKDIHSKTILPDKNIDLSDLEFR